MINDWWLADKGFKLEQYKDGMFWVLRHPEKDIFIQLSEDLARATLWQNGWVDDYLTEEEINKAVSFINNSKEV